MIDYESYWNMVLGVADAEGVVRDNDLGDGGSRHELSTWLGAAEQVAIEQGDDLTLEDCEPHHERALDDLERYFDEKFCK